MIEMPPQVTYLSQSTIFTKSLYLPLSNMRVHCLLFVLSLGLVENKELNVRKFPKGFQFGAATSSYQVEGAWDEDGKSENIWDHWTHAHTEPCFVADCTNADIASDSYHQYKRDVEMMRELGLDFYRFSISWTRILPTSFPDQINEAGVQYYNNLIDEMLKYNIKPIVTLFHWDLPQKLQDMGGFTNPYIVDWYSDYVRVVFSLFGDRVKTWITINEPHIICYYGYGNDVLAPRLNIKGIAEYMCAKNLLLAHAKAYHMYHYEFNLNGTGEIGIALDAQWYEPASEKDEDIAAALDHHTFTWQQYAHPIFSKTGDFPIHIKEAIAEKSRTQGFLRSRLPELTKEEVDYIRGTSDFFGLNHYLSYLVYRNESVNGYHESPSFFDDMSVISYQPPEWILGVCKNYYLTPWGFYKLLMKIKEDYNSPRIYITENGSPTTTGLVDDDRVTHYVQYLDAMLDAIDDGADVKAYTAWSLMDNFEWYSGYTDHFGFYEVDDTDPARTRTPRKSAFVYKEILRTRQLDPHFQPADISVQAMTIDEGH